MSRSSINDVLSLGDPALTWNFGFFFPSIPGSADTRDITYRCQTVDLPGQSLEAVEASLHGVTVQYAGRKIYTHTFNVVLMETVDWAAREKIVRWQDLARDWRTNSGSNLVEYSTTGLIIVTDNDNTPIRTTRINYVWPESIQEVTLDGTQSAIVTQQVTFRYTTWEDI